MVGVSFEIKGIEELTKKLTKDTIQTPLQKAIKEITLLLDRETKIATPVDTGRLRASIYSKVEPLQGKVGTIVDYAKFVEFGTQKMEARHIEGGRRVFGQGMFAYALERIKDRMKEIMEKIGKEIEARFNQ